MRKVLTSARRRWRLRSATALAAAGAMTVSMGVVFVAATTAQVNADEPCVPQDAWTEVIQHAAVTHTEQRMTDPGQPYIAPTEARPGYWTNLVWHVWPGNPVKAGDPIPTATDPNWEQRPAEPNGEHEVPPREPGVPYNVSNAENGNASWFLWKGDWVPAVKYDPGQPFIAPSYTTVTVVDKAAWTETINHPAVICDVTELAPAVTFTDPTCEDLDGADWDGTLEAFLDYEATGVVGPGETVTVEAMVELGYEDEYELAEGAETEFTHTFADITLADCVQGEETVIPKPDKPEPKPDKAPTVKGVEVVAPPAAAPTAVAAGLPGDSGTTAGQLLGQALAGLGLVMLAAAGWLGAPRRIRGVHQS